MFVVMNRISNDNVVEAVTADFQMELTDQFLLYRNAQAEILGVWFYSPPERAATHRTIRAVACILARSDAREGRALLKRCQATSYVKSCDASQSLGCPCKESVLLVCVLL